MSHCVPPAPHPGLPSVRSHHPVSGSGSDFLRSTSRILNSAHSHFPTQALTQTLHGLERTPCLHSCPLHHPPVCQKMQQTMLLPCAEPSCGSPAPGKPGVVSGAPMPPAVSTRTPPAHLTQALRVRGTGPCAPASPGRLCSFLLLTLPRVRLSSKTALLSPHSFYLNHLVSSKWTGQGRAVLDTPSLDPPECFLCEIPWPRCVLTGCSHSVTPPSLFVLWPPVTRPVVSSR